MKPHDAEETPLFCARCAAELRPRQGNFYVVRIEAFADPTPPIFTDEDLTKDHQKEIERLLSTMEDQSEQELADQVYRRLVLHLCEPCYREWIENPTG